MKREYKLIKRQEFQFVLSKQKQICSSKLTIFYYYNPSFNHPRFGVIATKKKFKRAVDRNYYRRVVYEAIRLNNPDSFPVNDYVIFIEKKIITDFNFLKLRTELLNLSNKLKSCEHRTKI